MSDTNPYSPTQHVSPNRYGISKVSVRPIEVMHCGYALVG